MGKSIHKGVGYVIRCLVPDLEDLFISFGIAHESASVCGFIFVYYSLSLVDYLLLVFRHYHVADGNGRSCLGGVVITGALDMVEDFGCFSIAVSFEALGYDPCEVSLLYKEVYLKAVFIIFPVYESEILRDPFVEDESSYCGFHEMSGIVFV